MAPTPTLRQARAAMSLADHDPRRAIPAAERASRLGRHAGDRVAVALAEQAWGHSLLQCADVDEAIVHLRRAVRFAGAAGSAALAGEARMKLAYAMVQRGRPQAALRTIGLALRTLDGTPGAVARAQRAVIAYQIGRLDEAFADYQVAVPLLRRSDDRLNLQRALMNRGILLAERHQFAAAVADLTEADAIARELGRHLVVGIIAENRGFVETLRGDVPAALRCLDSAERDIVRHGGQVAPVLQDRGELLLSAGLATEAAAVAERAVRAFERDKRALKVPELRMLLAQAALLGGDPVAGRAHAELATREFDRQDRSAWAALARLTALRARLAVDGGRGIRLAQVTAVVNTLAGTGWPAAAVEARLVAARVAAARGERALRRAHLAQAGSAARRRGPAALRARGWYAEALLRDDDGDRAGALSAVRAGLRILDEHHAALGATDLRAHSAVHRAELTELGLRLALREGKPGRVFEWAERGRANWLSARPVLPPRDPELADLTAQVRVVSLRLDRGDPGQATLRQRQVALEHRIRDLDRLRPGAGHGRTRPASPAAVRAALGGQAMVEYFQLDGDLHALTLVDGRLRLRRIGAVAHAAELLDRVLFALRRLASGDRAAARSPSIALLDRAAAALDALVLGHLPEVADLPLVVVPTGALHSVPWSALPSCVGRAVTVAPSATVWLAARSVRTVERPRVAVVAGPTLPGARAEAEAVAAVHGTTAVVGDQATVDAVLAALGTADVIHLAAHGRLAVDNPLFSALLLHDGPLVAYDLERLPRVPHTVVLASCDTGRSVVCAGDELLGLAATFVGRGTAQVVASVVPIPDLETMPLMVALQRGLAAGLPAARALARAQLQVRDAGATARAGAAGFVCIGA
ncbi:CHAT domain-containing protein [Actinokineospora sp.]|uniref:CHAT domain-containing protein n=1 Tax=Actinokineospora sp. TaxID=1872133 RepID=UPI00403798E9